MSDEDESDLPLDDAESFEDLREALAVSLRPRDIDARRHEDILARALGTDVMEGAEVEAEADAEETRRADVLRELLAPAARGSTVGAEAGGERRLADLARALRLAYAPHDIDQLTNERVLRPGLALSSKRTARRYVAVTAFALVAAAAAVFVFIGRSPQGSQRDMRAQIHALPMIGAHSTMSLFDPGEPFPRSGGTTSRIDKIAASRNGELRDNLFASWGVE